jgi:WD40 repeat protein
VPDARRAVELVFQQRSAEQWSEAEASLFDSQFLFAKVGAGMALDLDSEYQALLQEAPEHALQWCKALGLIQGALRLSMDVVAKDPSQFASQMVGRLLTDRRAPTEAKGWSGRLARTLGLKQSERPNPVVQKFLGSVVQAAPRPWLQPLHAALHPPGTPLLRTLSGHSGGVSGVAVIGDGRRAVSASNDKTLKVWDLETGRELRTLSGHSHTISGVAVSEDGRRAVSASYDQTLKVWDLETGQELATLYGHSDVVNGVAVSEDGRRAVSAGWDQTLKVWDLETGREIRTLYGHSDVVNGVAVSGDGRRAVSASFDRTLEVWDLETGRELRTLSGHSS